MTSDKVDINGWPIHYEIFGSGSHIVLLIPGAIGTGRSDFIHQLQGTSALNMKKYKFVAIELPGWGRSRKPERPYGPDVYYNDADVCFKLMQHLGHSCYSVMGWSDGAKVALLMPILYPAKIMKCIVIGIVVDGTEKDVKAVLACQNTKFWANNMMANYKNVYGDDVQFMWDNHMRFCEKMLDLFPTGILSSQLGRIRCPLFVLHGDQDPMVSLEHPQSVVKLVSDARLHRFPNGSHNLHQMYPKEFKRLVEEFLDEECEM